MYSRCDGAITEQEIKMADTQAMSFGCLSFLGDAFASDECCDYYTLEELRAIAERALGGNLADRWKTGIDEDITKKNNNPAQRGFLGWFRSTFTH